MPSFGRLPRLFIFFIPSFIIWSFDQEGIQFRNMYYLECGMKGNAGSFSIFGDNWDSCQLSLRICYMHNYINILNVPN